MLKPIAARNGRGIVVPEPGTISCCEPENPSSVQQNHAANQKGEKLPSFLGRILTNFRENHDFAKI